MTKRTTGCYTPKNSSLRSVSGNCQCEPCCEPVLINSCDIGETQCTPILTDVIKNCTVDFKQDVAYPDNIVFQTRNLPRAANTSLTGTICIRSIELSYNCIGLVPDSASSLTTPVWINSVEQTFTVKPSCTAADSTDVTVLFNEDTGSVRTSQCCCNGSSAEYSQLKVVNKQLDFAVSDLVITIRGRIGNCEFIADSVGLVNCAGTGIDTFDNINPIFLSDLGFCVFNFSEKLCLPTNEQVRLNEIYDTSLSVDCIQPVTETYSSTVDPIETKGSCCQKENYPNVSFEAAAEIAVFIKKSLYASVRKAVAVLSTDTTINCQRQVPKMPSEPANVCMGNEPCPRCIRATNGYSLEPADTVSQCGSSNVICPPIP